MQSCVLLGLSCHLAVGFCSFPSVLSPIFFSFLTSGMSTLWTFCYIGLLATLVSFECFFFFSQVHKISLYPSSVVWGSQLLQSAIKWRSLVTSTDLRGLLLPSVTLLLCLSLHPGCITEHIGVLLYTVNKNREPQLFPAPVAFSYFSWCYDHWQNAT